MESEEDGYFEDPEDMEEEEADLDISNSLSENRFREYKDLTRPAVNYDLLREDKNDLCLMGIDVTYTNKPVKNKQGIYRVN